MFTFTIFQALLALHLEIHCCQLVIFFSVDLFKCTVKLFIDYTAYITMGLTTEMRGNMTRNTVKKPIKCLIKNRPFDNCSGLLSGIQAFVPIKSIEIFTRKRK